MCNQLLSPGLCLLGKAASGVAGGVASSVGSSIFSDLAHWWADAYKSLLGAFSAAFLHAGDVSIAQYQASGLWKLELGIGMVLAAGGIIWAGCSSPGVTPCGGGQEARGMTLPA